MNNIEYKQDVTKDAEGQSLLNDGLEAHNKELERICACVHKSGHYATIERIPGIGYYVSTNYGTINNQKELEEWMGKVSFRFPHVACV